MAGIDIGRNIPRYEAGDTRQFTLTMSVTVPATVAFAVYNTDGSTLSLNAVQQSEIVGSSASGVFYFNRVLPDSRGFYSYRWTAWDSASRPYQLAGEFEIIRTEAYSFFTYGNPQDIVRSARQLFGATDITFGEMAPYCQAADDYINMYLGKVTTVPLGSVSPIFADMSKVFALWRFYSDRYSTGTKDAPPPIVARKKDYDLLLNYIACGSVFIPGIVMTDDPITVWSMPDGTHKAVFDMRDMTEQHVSAELMDEEAARDSSWGEGHV